MQLWLLANQLVHPRLQDTGIITSKVIVKILYIEVLKLSVHVKQRYKYPCAYNDEVSTNFAKQEVYCRTKKGHLGKVIRM